MKTPDINMPSHLQWEEKTIAPQGNNVLGKDDFMKLLLTQLQNQDPLNPMEHEQFAAQLAQFGSLEKLTGIEEGIKKVHSGVTEDTRHQAIGMIGRQVRAQGHALELKRGEGASFAHSLPAGARPLRATIYDGQGGLVRTLDIANQAPDSLIQWDGRDEQGKEAPPGSYSFRVMGVGADGKAVDGGSDVSGTVTGVEVRGDKPMLLVETGSGQQRVEVAKVLSVSVAPGSASVNAPGAATEKPVSVQTALRERAEGVDAESDVETVGEGRYWNRGFDVIAEETFPLGMRRR